MFEFDTNNLDIKTEITEISSSDIAVIGIGLELPGVSNKDEFWEELRQGRNFTSDFPNERRKDSDLFKRMIKIELDNYKPGCYFEHIDRFDYAFFNISPKEASLMSPIQRMFLQVSLKALDDAGYTGEKIRGSRTGVYIGHESDAPYDYKNYISAMEPSMLSMSVTGNLTSIISGRISHFLDLKGPCITIDTACSSSLVAVHVARKAILDNECDMALVGSARINYLPLEGLLEFGVASSDGRTRTFDVSADGTGTGEGIVAIMLKSYNQALHDNDHIYGVIKGSAVNHDGRSIGLTAPNASAQRDVIIDAWKNAEVSCEDISYIEAHGTGTKLGDPVEILGISKAFETYTKRKQFCAIGSVKANVGHLDNSSGILGLVKVLLMLQHKEIPPLPNFNFPNKEIDFINSPVYVNDKVIKWVSHKKQRLCGVSSFSFCGTNCHMIVSEHMYDNSLTDNEDSSSYRIFTLSAKSLTALQSLTKKYYQFIHNRNVNISDLCYTMNTGRSHYGYRIALLTECRKDKLIESLSYMLKNWFSISGHNGIYANLNGVKSEELLNFEKSVNWKEKRQLEDICQSYISGHDINWQKLWVGTKKHTISLPPYIFDITRCWVESASENKKLHEYIYKDIWNPLNMSKTKKRHNVEGNYVIIIGQDKNFCGDISKYYQSKEQHVTIIKMSGELCEYEKTFNNISKGEEVIINLIVTEENSLNEAVQSIKYISLFLNKMQPIKTRIVIMTRFAFQVTGKEPFISAQNATLIGYSYSLRWENPWIEMSCFDTDMSVTADIFCEYANSFNSSATVALRDKTMYIKSVEAVKPNELKPLRELYKKQGVYIVVGGTGGIGKKVVEYLNSLSVPVVVITRTALAGSVGHDFTHFTCDICDKKRLNEVITQIRDKYQVIKGVFHCAGVSQGNLLYKQELIEAQDIWSSKINGTDNLLSLLSNDNLDIFVLFSSAITLIGGKGSSAYTAGNSYLDTCIYKGRNIISIGWAAWENTGFASKAYYDEKVELFEQILPDLAIEILDVILKSGLKHVYVGRPNSKSELGLIKDRLPFEYTFEQFVKTSKPLTSNKSVILMGRKNGVYGDIEREIASVWQTVLGYKEIDVNSNYFEIGGDSISLTKVYDLLKDMYPEKIKMSDMFAYPTIKELAEYLNDTYQEATEDSIDKLLDSLSQGELDVNAAIRQLDKLR